MLRGIVKIGLHAVVGGAMAMAQGGSFASGAFTGAISAGSSLAMDESGVMGHSGDGDAGNIAARTAVAAIAGGTASMLSGGKFANGAITGAFAQLYNADGGAERVKNWSSYGAAAGATTGGVLAAAGCTAASGGGCALAAPETFAAGSLAGVPIGAGIGWAAANMANGIVDTANMVYDYVHGNSLASPRQTTVYQLTGPDGSIQKYGITSEGDPRDRYSAEFYRTTGVEMKILATYPYRLPARAHEFALCTAYVGAVGKLPPMSARC